MPGLMASMATFDASLGLTGCRSTGEISLVGTRIGGALFLDRAQLTAAVTAVDGTWLRVGTDSGAVRLRYAEVTSRLCFEQATLVVPEGKTALDCRHVVARELVLLPAEPPVGQQPAYHPRGASVWLAYALIGAGLLLVTTIAAAGARRLRRD